MLCCCSVNRSDSLWLHKLQHSRLPYPYLVSPSVCSDSCPFSQWCYLTISFSAIPSIFPNIGVFFNESALCSGGQSNGVSASVLPVNIQDRFHLGLTGLMELLYWFDLFSCFLLVFLGFWLSAFSCLFVFIERCV